MYNSNQKSVFLRARAHVYELDPTQFSPEDIRWIWRAEAGPSGYLPPTIEDLHYAGNVEGAEESGIIKFSKMNKVLKLPAFLARGKANSEHDSGKFKKVIESISEGASRILEGHSPYLVANLSWNVYLPGWDGLRLHFLGARFRRHELFDLIQDTFENHPTEYRTEES